MRRNLGMGLVALLVLAAIGYGFRPPAVLVDAAPVVREPLRVSVKAEGMTRIRDRFEVSAPVAGYLQRIPLRAGDPVHQGMVLARLEPTYAEVLDPRSRALASARLAAAEAALQVARENALAAAAEARYARSESQRLARLCEVACIVTEDELERAEAQAQRSEASHRSAQFAVQVARHEVAAAATALEHFSARPPGETGETVQVLAPVNGRVLGLRRESEGVVAAGQPLLEIGDPDALEVVVDLLSSDAVRIEAGTRVLFERWGGEQVLEGRVAVIEPNGFTKVSALGVEEQRVWVVVELTSPPQAWQRLGGGYRVEASFILWEADAILQIPASALFRHHGEWAVFVVEQGRAQRRAVTPGQGSGLRVQILEGLREGEQVILHPDVEIETGSRVQRRQ